MGMRLLIIEDNDRLRESLVSGLRSVGHTVDAAADGSEGWLIASEARHDLIVLDRMLPGLDAGADDYLTKPFSTKELLARIRAVLRRKAPEALDSAVEVSGLRLDPATRRVTRGTQEVKIGPTEFRLLHFFMTHTERVHSRTQLLDRVWGDHVFIEERTVDVHVKRLREALAPVQCSTLIETVRGAGYRLTQQAAATSV